tara:strand:+ start:1707 stop:2216 length:510 start_codon:yes stop_codon:yes gene_type:complete
MKDKYFFLFCFLAIFSILYYKFKKFNTIIEGVAKCDPNKPTVYSKGGKRSAKTCQKLRQSQDEDNMKKFKYALANAKKDANKLLKKHKELISKHKEMNGHIKQTVKSLDCQEIELPGPIPIYALNCAEPASSDSDDSDDEVDVGSKRRNALAGANRYSPPKRNIGGMAL